MQRSQAEANQLVFDRLLAQKEQIETAFAAELDWLPLPGRTACRIQFAKPVDGYNKDHWPEMIKWLVEHMTRLDHALQSHLEKIKPELRSL